MTVYVVYKRNKENQSDTMVSYSTDRATAEQLIPPNLEKDFYIQEMPKLDIAKPVYSSGLVVMLKHLKRTMIILKNLLLQTLCYTERLFQPSFLFLLLTILKDMKIRPDRTMKI